jgi:hypothetical protein
MLKKLLAEIEKANDSRRPRLISEASRGKEDNLNSLLSQDHISNYNDEADLTLYSGDPLKLHSLRRSIERRAPIWTPSVYIQEHKKGITLLQQRISHKGKIAGLMMALTCRMTSKKCRGNPGARYSTFFAIANTLPNCVREYTDLSHFLDWEVQMLSLKPKP